MGRTVDPKMTTNYCFSLDIHDIKNYGFLKPGIISGSFKQRFKQSGRTLETFIISDNKQHLVLHYKRNGKNISYKVLLTYSHCNYGGTRPWFRCPNTNCNRQVGMLFLAGNYYLCRHCHNLAYETQSMNEAFRLLEKAQNIREQLGAESLATTDPFPEKPKGMHWKTYSTLRNKYWGFLDRSWGMAADKWGVVI